MVATVFVAYLYFIAISHVVLAVKYPEEYILTMYGLWGKRVYGKSISIPFTTIKMPVLLLGQLAFLLFCTGGVFLIILHPNYTLPVRSESAIELSIYAFPAIVSIYGVLVLVYANRIRRYYNTYLEMSPGSCKLPVSFESFLKYHGAVAVILGVIGAVLL